MSLVARWYEGPMSRELPRIATWTLAATLLACGAKDEPGMKPHSASEWPEGFVMPPYDPNRLVPPQYVPPPVPAPPVEGDAGVGPT